MNVVILMGRLTRDPELKYTPNSGAAYARFAIAVQRDIKNKEGKRETDFFEIEAWKHTAEFVCKYFRKGSMIALQGALQTRKYTDKDGVEKKITTVVANSFHFTGEGKREEKQIEQSEDDAPF